MRVVVDKYIPFLGEALSGLGADVRALEPGDITREALDGADALFVRTRTRVDADLLDGTQVRFVATATIGTDHIDGDYLSRRGIYWTAAPGCNAQAVCDYVEEAIEEFAPSARTIGIVGCGHVGSRVRAMAERRGMRVMVSDPPIGMHLPLREIAAEADVLTFHTPLTHEGEHATYHLCNAELLRCCRANTLIINAARGGVADEKALLASGLGYVLDTWEGEPRLNPQVLAGAKGATFHIAGYSTEGKINASQQVLDAFCMFFGLSPCTIDKKAVSLHTHSGDSAAGWIGRITDALKARPEAFEQMRKGYVLR